MNRKGLIVYLFVPSLLSFPFCASLKNSHFSSYTAKTQINSEATDSEKVWYQSHLVKALIWTVQLQGNHTQKSRDEAEISVCTLTLSRPELLHKLSSFVLLLYKASLSPPAYVTHSRVKQVRNTLTLIV